MKIGVLVCDLSSGGAERVASLWIKGFCELGHTVSVILNSNNPILFNIPDNVERYNMCINSNGYFLKYLFYLFRIIKLRRIVKRIQPDVIIAVLHPMGLYAKIATLGMKCKIINTEHNAFERPNDMPLNKISRFNKYYTNRLFDSVTVLTSVDRKLAENKLKRVVVMPNPLSFPAIDGQCKNNRQKQIIAVGRIDAWRIKGFDIIIKTWNELCPEYPDWSLLIAGKGKKENIDYLKTLGPNCIQSNQLRFEGFVEDMPGLYRTSEIFILSSRHEGFGMALLEAMSQGCACITSDYKGRQREIVGESECAIILDDDSIIELKTALSRVINDPELRDRLRINAIQRSNDFSLNKIMNQWDELIHSVVNK